MALGSGDLAPGSIEPEAPVDLLKEPPIDEGRLLARVDLHGLIALDRRNRPDLSLALYTGECQKAAPRPWFPGPLKGHS